MVNDVMLATFPPSENQHLTFFFGQDLGICWRNWVWTTNLQHYLSKDIEDRKTTHITFTHITFHIVGGSYYLFKFPSYYLNWVVQPFWYLEIENGHPAEVIWTPFYDWNQLPPHFLRTQQTSIYNPKMKNETHGIRKSHESSVQFFVFF